LSSAIRRAHRGPKRFRFRAPSTIDFPHPRTNEIPVINTLAPNQAVMICKTATGTDEGWSVALVCSGAMPTLAACHWPGAMPRLRGMPSKTAPVHCILPCLPLLVAALRLGTQSHARALLTKKTACGFATLFYTYTLRTPVLRTFNSPPFAHNQA